MRVALRTRFKLGFAIATAFPACWQGLSYPFHARQPCIHFMKNQKIPSRPATQLSSDSHRVCPVTGRLLDQPKLRPGVLGWLFSGMGLASLLWFLVRVLPKPSRAAYPCQRVAFPLASGFVVWLLAVLGSAFAWRKARKHRTSVWRACLWGAAGVACCAMVVASLPAAR